jgi:beta-lactamase regulating signal transducer with metallopeptidase domain
MLESANLLAWMEQALILALAGSLSLRVLRVRHPRTQLAFCHALLAMCLLLPFLQPWRHPVIDVSGTEEDPVTAAPSPAPSAEIRKSAIPAPAPPIPQSPVKTQIPWTRVVLWTLIAGVAAKLCWLLGGLWRIRKYRIGAMPLYPIPESVQAAAAITHANAVFCISPDVSGPVMLGWLAPVVLLPESFLTLGEEAQCGIACHELLHVRRHDWLSTLIEELAGALLWFNPAIWLLLAQTRLVREQLVDAEVVRLTASREPYIDALLAIARGGPVPDLSMDLAPAPLFLRRRHLTQRMHSLLQDVSISRLRLVSSYASIAAVLILAGWFGIATFPLTGSPQFREAAKPAPVAPPQPQPLVQSQIAQSQIAQSQIAPADTYEDISSVPLPPDPHELVTGAVRVVATPADRAAALSLLDRARQNGNSHAAGTPPFRFDVSFNAGGPSAYTGTGALTETWLSGQSWRWTVDLGGYSLVRVDSGGLTVEDKHVSQIPMRALMLRNAIFWAMQATPFQIRTASAAWNGKAATCLLLSGMAGPAAQTQSRLWEETEYCIDNASGLLQIHSIAPGTYTVYGYSRDLQFHGRTMPDRITIYVAGAQVVDAEFNITDAGTVDPALLTPTREMIANGPVIQTMLPSRFPVNVPNPFPSKTIQPVIVHADVDGAGNVLEEELSAASDPALAQPALDLVRQMSLPHAAFTQRQEYVNVRFHPTSR